MITYLYAPGATAAEVTFATAPSEPPGDTLAVVGDFNDWDPTANPMTCTDGGEWRTTVEVPAGARYAFRYLGGNGQWYDDDYVDAHEPNGMGGTNGVLDIPAVPGEEPAP